MLRLCLLGGFAVEVDGRPVPGAAWRLSKARTLLQLLALSPSGRVRRQQVGALLWPDLQPAAAAHNLRTTLHAARRALAAASASGPGYIAADRLDIALVRDERVWIDVAAFETAARAALDSAQPAVCWEAASLYAGDLQVDDPEEDWSAPHRAALRTHYLAVLSHAAELYVRRGELDQAIAALGRVVEAEPAQEAGHAALMRLYAATGDRHRAVRQFQLLREALHRELDLEPEPATVRLYEQIVSRRFSLPGAAHATVAAVAAGGGSAAPGPPLPAEEPGKMVVQLPAHVAAVVGVAQGPLALALNAAAGLLFVACSGTRDVWVLDARTYELRTRTQTSDHPHAIAINHATQRAYVANYLGRTVCVLDAGSGALLGRATLPSANLPRGIAVDAATNRVYVATRRNKPLDGPAGDALMVLDGSTLETVASIAVGALPCGVAVDSGARRVYVANSWSYGVSVVDADRNRVLDTVMVGDGPCLLALDPRAGRLYVTHPGSDRLSVVECATGRVLAAVPCGAGPYGVAVNPDSGLVYVAAQVSDTLCVIRGNTGGDTGGDTYAVVDRVFAGRSPAGITLDPAGGRILVTNYDADTVAVIEAAHLAPGACPHRDLPLAR